MIESTDDPSAPVEMKAVGISSAPFEAPSRNRKSSLTVLVLMVLRLDYV
jgi:hypothetical protein